VVQAWAHDLPFADGAFAAALATLTIHHWSDSLKGLQELRRVAREQVVLLTWDPASHFWLIDEYFPELEEMDRRIFPTLEDLDPVDPRLGIVLLRVLLNEVPNLEVFEQ
jgi:ubiquinone/menaquinone biosynthesis C-methylase UbiE